MIQGRCLNQPIQCHRTYDVGVLCDVGFAIPPMALGLGCYMNSVDLCTDVRPELCWCGGWTVMWGMLLLMLLVIVGCCGFLSFKGGASVRG